MTLQLSDAPTQDEILAHINTFKVKALNLAMTKLSDEDSKLLEPRELKTLVDLTLNIEDSLDTEGNEGEQARTISRLLNKYGNTDYNEDFVAPALSEQVTLDE